MKAIDLFEDGRLEGMTPNGKLLLVYLHLLAEEAGTPEDALAFLSEEDVRMACDFDSVHDARCAMAECAEYLKAESGESGKKQVPTPSPFPSPPLPPSFPTPHLSPYNPPLHPSSQPACAGAFGANEKPASTESGKSGKSGTRYTYDEVFEAWWRAYPGTRKDSKSRAYAKWKQVLKRGDVLHSDLFCVLLRWINSEEWQKDGGQFICAPLVWLNKERWMAEPKPGRTILTEIKTIVGTFIYKPPATAPASSTPTHDAKLKEFLLVYPKGPNDFDRLLFAWESITKALKVSPDDLIRAAKLAQNSKQFTDDDGRFIPRPERWLEDKGWNPYVSKFEEERKARAIQHDAHQPPPDLGFDPFGKD